MAARKSSGVHVSWPKPNFVATVKTNKNFSQNFNGAMMYAHYELTAADLKKEVIKYIKSKDTKDPMLDRIRDLNENRFNTIGKYMYILNHGSDIPDDIYLTLIPALEKIVSEEETKIAAEKKEQEFLDSKDTSSKNIGTDTKNIPTIQDRLREKTREVAGEVEGWLDDFYLERKTATPKTVEEFVNLFKTFDLKASHMRHMQLIFERRANHIAKVAEWNNKDLIEGYSNFTKAEIVKFDTFYKNLLKACDMLQEVAKVERAPRKKKPVSQEKLISKLKYKKDDISLGIVSLNPVQIPGSKEVWVYNTKTRKLAQYKALDERGISVKGASLINYSSDSLEKTVRKPAETLSEFKKASKVKLRTFLKELSTVDVPAQGKLNENHVILRVDK